MYDIFNRNEKYISKTTKEVLSMIISQKNSLYRIPWYLPHEEYSKITHEDIFDYCHNFNEMIDFNTMCLEKYARILQQYNSSKIFEELKNIDQQINYCKSITKNENSIKECEEMSKELEQITKDIKTTITEEQYKIELENIINEYSENAQKLYHKVFISSKEYVESREVNIKNKLIEEQTNDFNLKKYIN